MYLNQFKALYLVSAAAKAASKFVTHWVVLGEVPDFTLSASVFNRHFALSPEALSFAASQSSAGPAAAVATQPKASTATASTAH